MLFNGQQMLYEFKKIYIYFQLTKQLFQKLVVETWLSNYKVKVSPQVNIRIYQWII